VDLMADPVGARRVPPRPTAYESLGRDEDED